MAMWRTIHAEDGDWEVRLVPAEQGGAATPETIERQDVLEFRSPAGLNPPRRVAVDAFDLETTSDDELQQLFRQARPIGGDFYGRPGKRMPDMNP